MLIRQLVVLICAVALSVMGVVSGSIQGSVSGDVNGDRLVDVLDLQMVIGDALAARMPDRLTDVNGDGRTDVLDLQLTFRRTREPVQEPDAPPNEFSLEALRLSLPIFTPMRCAQCQEALAALRLPRVHRAFPAVKPRPASCRTERYLYRLTPHAPPSCA